MFTKYCQVQYFRAFVRSNALVSSDYAFGQTMTPLQKPVLRDSAPKPQEPETTRQTTTRQPCRVCSVAHVISYTRNPQVQLCYLDPANLQDGGIFCHHPRGLWLYQGYLERVGIAAIYAADRLLDLGVDGLGRAQGPVIQCGDLGLRLGLRMLGFGLVLFPRYSTTTPTYVCFLKLVYSKS